MDNQPACMDQKASVVGLYGVPGTGKTTLLGQLKQQKEANYFTFYDGSDVIDTVVSGGLDAFKRLPEDDKMVRRQEAITKIGEECAKSGKVGVVAGHCMFWSENEEAGRWVITDADLATYTHILYLDVPANIVAERCQADTERIREPSSEVHLANWQREEKKRLRKECRAHGILLSILRSETRGLGLKLLEHTLRSILDFKDHTEHINLLRATARLDEIVDGSDLETMLVIDGDRTLTAEDTGSLFFEQVARLRQSVDENDPLKTLFSSPMQYSYIAFRQATLLYEDVAYELGDADIFDLVCEKVADEVTVRPEFRSLMKLAAESQHVGAIVLSCGMGLIWEMVLEKAGLREKVKVIGGGRLQNGFVVTAAVKGALVSRLREQYQVYIWAFGDSLLDLDMLRMANEAIVVVDERRGAENMLGIELTKAIDFGGPKAKQMLLPRKGSSNSSSLKLPKVQLAEVETQIRHPFLIHATEKSAAKLLMTPTRDANMQGPALQDAHRRIGTYLATEFLTDVIGLEGHLVPHVQEGKSATGYRLLSEDKTLIVALMRGGLPMAEGVNEVIPRAEILHAKHPDDLTLKYLTSRSLVVLVDAVINEGATVTKFVEHIRRLNATTRILVVAGVVQAQSAREHGSLRTLARKHGKMNIIALRLSENKYTGSGTTDTGNRLFNSTHLQ